MDWIKQETKLKGSGPSNVASVIPLRKPTGTGTGGGGGTVTKSITTISMEHSWFFIIQLLPFSVKMLNFYKHYEILYHHVFRKDLNPLSGNPTKWSNTLKQFVGNLLTNFLSVFDHFVRLALKGLSLFQYHETLMYWLYFYRWQTKQNTKITKTEKLGQRHRQF